MGNWTGLSGCNERPVFFLWPRPAIRLRRGSFRTDPETQGLFTGRGRNRASGTIGRRDMTPEEGQDPCGVGRLAAAKVASGPLWFVMARG
jgi:hypothetical protein